MNSKVRSSIGCKHQRIRQILYIYIHVRITSHDVHIIHTCMSDSHADNQLPWYTQIVSIDSCTNYAYSYTCDTHTCMRVRPAFIFVFIAYSGFMRAAGAKNTEHETAGSGDHWAQDSLYTHNALKRYKRMFDKLKNTFATFCFWKKNTSWVVQTTNRRFSCQAAIRA